MEFRGRNKIRPDFNFSSMTDVVFLLLIFFMIASTLAKQLNTINIELPKADGKSENRNTVAVTINNSNQFFINQRQINRSQLQGVLLSELSQLATPSMVLRAENKVGIDQVVFVLDMANKNGVKVVLAVNSE